MDGQEERIMAMYERFRDNAVEPEAASTLTLATIVAELPMRRFTVKIDNPPSQGSGLSRGAVGPGPR